jgi:hypothetical protein
MTTLLGFDPGLSHPAGALFVSGVLQKASRVKIPKGITTKTPIAERCRAIALAVTDWAGVIPDVLVIEWPQIYTADKSKGNPNQLVPLAAMGACLSGLYLRSKVISPTPREWTGNVKKDEEGDPWASPRGLRVKSRLSDIEFKRVIPSHDAVDAVGLGLYGLGRFNRRRVYETG